MAAEEQGGREEKNKETSAYDRRRNEMEGRTGKSVTAMSGVVGKGERKGFGRPAR